jgi:hypothetical protein
VPLDDIFVERVQSNGFGTVDIEPPVANAVVRGNVICVNNKQEKNKKRKKKGGGNE